VLTVIADIDALTVLIDPGTKADPRALIYDVVIVEMVVADAILEILIVEKLPKLPTILLAVIDDATNDEVKSCEYTLPSL